MKEMKIIHNDDLNVDIPVIYEDDRIWFMLSRIRELMQYSKPTTQIVKNYDVNSSKMFEVSAELGRDAWFVSEEVVRNIGKIKHKEYLGEWLIDEAKHERPNQLKFDFTGLFNSNAQVIPKSKHAPDTKQEPTTSPKKKIFYSRETGEIRADGYVINFVKFYNILGHIAIGGRRIGKTFDFKYYDKVFDKLMDKLTSNEVSTIDIDELLREFEIEEE